MAHGQGGRRLPTHDPRRDPEEDQTGPTQEPSARRVSDPPETGRSRRGWTSPGIGPMMTTNNQMAPRGSSLRGRDTRRSVLMPEHHPKRRLPVVHRNQRVPNLYRRPKPPTDRREGDTFEVIYR